MRETIKKLHPTILSAEDVLLIADRSVSVISKQCARDTRVAEILGDVNTGITLLQITIDRDRANELTPRLEKEDKARQRAILALKYHVISWMYRDNSPQNAEAAKKIHRLIQHVGLNIKELGYSTGSVRLSIFLKKLETEEYKEALELVDGCALVEELKSANHTFNVTFRLRANIKAKAKKIRKDAAKEFALHYLNVLFTHIGYQKEKSRGTYTTLVETINNIIRAITAVARARKTRKNKGKPEHNTTPGSIRGKVVHIKRLPVPANGALNKPHEGTSSIQQT